MPDDLESAVLSASDRQPTQPFVVPGGIIDGALPARRTLDDLPPDPLIPRQYPDRIEVKLDYEIDTKRRETHYRIESYFFVPRSLGLNAYTYSRDEFYADMHAYIRFKEPRIPAALLADPDEPDSPLHRARAALRRASGRLDTLSPDSLSYELRLYGCIVQTNLRDAAVDLHDKIDRLHSPDEQAVLVADVSQGIARLLAELDVQLQAFRSMRADFFAPKRPPWLSELFEYVDEYVSIAAESCLTSVVIHLDSNPNLRSWQRDERAKLVARVAAEQRHRKSAGYVRSTIDPNGENREYVHRRSALRKFMTSALFLDIRKKEEGRGIINVAAGVAAAVAMSFSTVAAIWSQGTYGLNSFPFLIAVVIGYVFKDRIKEWLRTYFGRLVAQRLYDFSVQIQDPTSKAVLGRCRESFEFVPPAKVPDDIHRHRHCDSTSVLEPLTKSEVVMKYVKDITLRGRRIAALGRGLDDINDIHRFNISRFLIRMNNPWEVVASYSPSHNRVVGVSCPKSYHLNLVVVRTADEQPMKVERYRFILDKRGVKMVQLVETTDRSGGYRL